MSHATTLDPELKIGHYLTQTGRRRLTPRQRKRVLKTTNKLKGWASV